MPLILEQFPDAAVQAIKSNIPWDECFQQLLKLGAIYKDQTRICHEFDVDATNVVRIHLMPRRYEIHKFSIENDVIYSHPSFFIVNKPAMVPVHPTLDNSTENLLFQLQNHFGGDVFATHRLDLETTGLMIFARGKASISYFQNIFMQRQIKKIYKAIVRKSGSEMGLQTHWMLKSDRSPKLIFDSAMENTVKIELAILDRRSFAKYDADCVDIELLTGKTHQIRAQMSHLGSPLLGDAVYGGSFFPMGSDYKHFLLHSYRLEFADALGRSHQFVQNPVWS